MLFAALFYLKTKEMKKVITNGSITLEGVKTQFDINSIKGMSFEKFKGIFKSRIIYTSQAKELQPDLSKIYEAIVGKKKVVRRKKKVEEK